MGTKFLDKTQIQSFQKEILDWFAKNKRDLPWRRVPYDTRLRQRNPYPILISEVMLQQTQVSRVIPKFEMWMKQFPNVQSLARASVRDVLALWSGLGYNRRALYLKRLAEELMKRSVSLRGEKRRSNLIQDRHASLAMIIIWPQTEEELVKLPGIGKYTARAILCFAFNTQVAVVDTNVRKVILTKFKDVSLNKAKDLYSSPLVWNDKIIQNIADQLLPIGKAYEWNQALMDYSFAVLKKEKILMPKQKKFIESDRFYRGQILKKLIEQKSSTIGFLQTYFEQQNHPIASERLKKILEKMEKDLLVQKKNNKVLLKE